ncbi:MAG TPA: hypothetical protein VJ724_08240, partial [Tahibacter sp.]|nr:hypothetical protein [Tahibacter sp.]
MRSRIVNTALLFVAFATPAAADWRYVETPPTRPIVSSDFMIAADGALWTFGGDGVHRTDAAGATAGPL